MPHLKWNLRVMRWGGHTHTRLLKEMALSPGSRKNGYVCLAEPVFTFTPSASATPFGVA